jgi:hypothetical protein
MGASTSSRPRCVFESAFPHTFHSIYLSILECLRWCSDGRSIKVFLPRGWLLHLIPSLSCQGQARPGLTATTTTYLPTRTTTTTTCPMPLMVEASVMIFGDDLRWLFFDGSCRRWPDHHHHHQQRELYSMTTALWR